MLPLVTFYFFVFQFANCDHGLPTYIRGTEKKRKERATREKDVTQRQNTCESLGSSTKVNVTQADVSDDVVDYTATNQIADVETESEICIPVIEHAEAGSIVSEQPEKQKGVAENKLFDFDIDIGLKMQLFSRVEVCALLSAILLSSVLPSVAK